jgi:hypothetical protein
MLHMRLNDFGRAILGSAAQSAILRQLSATYPRLSFGCPDFQPSTFKA